MKLVSSVSRLKENTKCGMTEGYYEENFSNLLGGKRL